jgi:hypothetical protein
MPDAICAVCGKKIKTIFPADKPNIIIEKCGCGEREIAIDDQGTIVNVD